MLLVIRRLYHHMDVSNGTLDLALASSATSTLRILALFIFLANDIVYAGGESVANALCASLNNTLDLVMSQVKLHHLQQPAGPQRLASQTLSVVVRIHQQQIVKLVEQMTLSR